MTRIVDVPVLLPVCDSLVVATAKRLLATTQDQAVRDVCRELLAMDARLHVLRANVNIHHVKSPWFASGR